MPVLKAKINDTWVPISGGAAEVAVGPDDPIIVNPAVLMWFNTVTDELLVAVNRRWQQVVQNANEVQIGPVEPPAWQAELWFDTNANPPTLNAYVNGGWKPVFAAPATGSEVEITDTDPLVTDPASSAELWLDTSLDPPVLKGYVAGAWEPITSVAGLEANEVQIGGPDPTVRYPDAELWYDTSGDPAVLKARVNDAWVDVTSPPVETLPPGGMPNQYLGKASTVDYQVSWQDIPRELPPLGTPGQVLTKTGPANPLGVDWADAAAGTATDEVLVAPDDPYATNPTAGIELWYDSDEVPVPTEGEVAINPDEPTDLGVELWYDEDATPALPTSGMRAFWDQSVTYAPGDQVLWPREITDIRLAHRPTVGEEPGLTGVIDAIDFNQASATLPQGLSATLGAALYSGGVDLRMYFRASNSVSFGTIACGTNAANIAVFKFGFYDTDPADATLPDVWRFEVLDNTAVHVVLEVDAASGFTSADLITYPFMRLVADATNQTLTMYKATDGVDWIVCGTPLVSANPLLLTGVEAIHLAHDNDAFENNWENILCAVETINYGSVKQTSWWARTQPNVATDKGIGRSPLTGEDYVDVNVCPRGTFTDFTTPWSKLTNQHTHTAADPELASLRADLDLLRQRIEILEAR